MKSIFLFSALLSSICVLSAPAPIPNPEPYIITQYVEETAVYTYNGYTLSRTTRSESTWVTTKTVRPTGTPTNGLRTLTDSTSYAEVTVIEVLLPPGSAPKATTSRNIYGTADDDYSYKVQSTRYAVPVTYTPLASCTANYNSQTWAITTNIPISIPYPVQGQITPLSVVTSTSTYTAYNDRLSLITSQYAILNPTDIPSSALESARSLYEPWGVAYCYTPTTTCTTVTSANGERAATCLPTFARDNKHSRIYDGNQPLDDGEYASHGRIYVILILVFVPFGWLLFFFLLGLLESYLSFKGLMLGKQRKRGVPYLWCCVNFLTLCCVGPTYKAKSVEEQAILAERWKEYKGLEKFKLWVKWGLKWKYPDVLGEAPEIDRRALRERCL